jgi:signal transduction histidine kinase/ActR/RegA family two-component response regulator
MGDLSSVYTGNHARWSNLDHRHLPSDHAAGPTCVDTWDVSTPDRRRRIDVLLAVGLLVLGVIATLAITGLTLNRVRSEAAEDTDARLASVGHEVEHQIAAYAERLYGLRADFARDPQLTREEFGELVDIEALTRRNPGAELVTFDRSDGRRLVVEYVEPWDPNTPILGVDINAEPVRRAAADFARRSGEVAATRPVNLIQPDLDRGFLLMLAAYDVSPIPVTEPARNRHFLGVLVTAFAADDVFQQSVRQPVELTFSVYDAGPTVEPPRRRPRAEDWITGEPVTDYTNYADIDVGSRRWRIVTDKPVPIRWADPVATAVIGLSLTVLAAGLFASLALGRQRAVGLAEQMTADLRTSERELREAKEEAERANEAKSEFLSRMSHELRTPLTAVLGFTEMLQLADIPPEQQRKFIDRTHNAGKHLLALINDVLDISQVETGTLAIEIGPVALGPIVDDVLALFGPQAASRGITIDNGIGAHDMVLADATRLRQVLVNLVSNAIKFNSDDGAVQLRSSTDNGNVLITVADTGRGIAAEDIPRLFQPFERLGVHTGEIEGTGIGLALSSALAEQMEGSLTVESALGQGSTFTLRLPRGESKTEHLPHEAGAEGTAEPTAMVLCIDNDPSHVVLVENALALRPGTQLLRADRASSGLDTARERLPDLVLLDLHLPDMPAEEFLSQLRADEATAHIPVVVVNTDTTPRRSAALVQAGAFALVPRPLAIRDLLETVDEALASAHQPK